LIICFVLDDLKKDELSHFILRLAFCRSAELRTWLLNQEVELFKWRFQYKLLRAEQAAFVGKCGELGKDCQVVTHEEFLKLKNELYAATRTNESLAPSADFFYKIKFERVTDLVKRRQVLMRAGWAFVHRTHILGMLAGVFRARLNKALVQLSRRWPSFARVERCRLLPIVAQLTADRRQLANPVDDKAVLQMFTKYIQRQGHSNFKTKQLGRDTVSIGQWTKPNEVDKCCPFAHRVHKSNTVFYTVYLSDKVKN
jgi:DNA primase large subunit